MSDVLRVDPVQVQQAQLYNEHVLVLNVHQAQPVPYVQRRGGLVAPVKHAFQQEDSRKYHRRGAFSMQVEVIDRDRSFQHHRWHNPISVLTACSLQHQSSEKCRRRVTLGDKIDHVVQHQASQQYRRRDVLSVPIGTAVQQKCC